MLNQWPIHYRAFSRSLTQHPVNCSSSHPICLSPLPLSLPTSFLQLNSTRHYEESISESKLKGRRQIELWLGVKSHLTCTKSDTATSLSSRLNHLLFSNTGSLLRLSWTAKRPALVDFIFLCSNCQSQVYQAPGLKIQSFSSWGLARPPESIGTSSRYSTHIQILLHGSLTPLGLSIPMIWYKYSGIESKLLKHFSSYSFRERRDF